MLSYSQTSTRVTGRWFVNKLSHHGRTHFLNWTDSVTPYRFLPIAALSGIVQRVQTTILRCVINGGSVQKSSGDVDLDNARMPWHLATPNDFHRKQYWRDLPPLMVIFCSWICAIWDTNSRVLELDRLVLTMIPFASIRASEATVFSTVWLVSIRKRRSNPVFHLKWALAIDTSNACRRRRTFIGLCPDRQSRPDCSRLTPDFICWNGECAASMTIWIWRRWIFVCHGARASCQSGERHRLSRTPPVLAPRLDHLRSSTRSSLNSLEVFSSCLASFLCNRGVGIPISDQSIVCFSPSEYHGERCQFPSDRMIWIVQWNFSRSIDRKRMRIDPSIELKLLVLFSFSRMSDTSNGRISRSIRIEGDQMKIGSNPCRNKKGSSYPTETWDEDICVCHSFHLGVWSDS